MSKASPDKTPSNELASLIKETAETYFTTRELWSRVLEKGKQEGFAQKELQDIAMQLLKDMLTRHQIRYLFHKDEMQETSNKQHDKMHNITQAVDYPLSVEFYKELDAMAELEKESRDSVSEAIKIAKEEGFSNQEIEQLIRGYLKDSVPKDVLDDWLKSNS
jgi:hypothetical protein